MSEEEEIDKGMQTVQVILHMLDGQRTDIVMTALMTALKEVTQEESVEFKKELLEVIKTSILGLE